MAITVESLAVSLRLEAVTDAQTAILTRLLGVGEAHVSLLIPAAPEPIQDECVVRLATYLFDAPVGRRDAYANAWVNSGAGALASRFKPQAASGSTGSLVTPVVTPDGGGTGLSESEVAALIEVHRELSEAHHVPGTGGGGLTESQVAARIETHKEVSEAHHRRSSIAGIVNVENGRLASSTGTVMRIGWSDSQAYDEQVFTRAGNHPDDGAAVGTIAGVFPPVQPTLPAIPDVAANEKYLHIWVGEIPGNVAQLTFFGSPAHGMSTAEAQTYNTTDGTWWRTNLPLSPGISAYAFSATVVGALIASQPYVDEAIAAIPASTGGGFPTTRTQVLSDTASSTNKAIQATEPFLPNQLYEVLVGAWARHIFLTIESGGYAVSYLVPDQALDLEAAPVDSPYFVCVLTIGSTVVSSFSLREQTGLITIPVTINKLT